MRVFFIGFVAVLICACGNGGQRTVTAPPASSRALVVVLVTDSGAMFTGDAVLAQRLVARVVDSAGNPTPYDRLALSAPTSWAIHGDTLLAPSTEAAGTIHVTASRNDTASAGAALTLADVFDLRTVGLVVSPVTCVAWQGRSVIGPVAYVDSVVEHIAFDSIVYQGVSAPPSLASQYPELTVAGWMRGTMSVYGRRADSTAIDTTFVGVNFGVLAVKRQVPDTLVLELGVAGNDVPVSRAGVSQSTWTIPRQMLTYPAGSTDHSGWSFCGDPWYWTVASDLVLTGTR
jgi:hypothetical protein